MHKQNLQIYWILFISFLYIFSCSCVSAKKTTYFYDVPDSARADNPLIMNPIAPFVETKIEPNDILSIVVQTIEQGSGNTPISSNTIGTFSPLSGFLVDKNGYVELSLIGFVKVAGLTTSEAREVIKQRAKEFYKEPVVNLRIANFDVVVLGDVGHVGNVNVPSEKASIIDVIALSGDLNPTAKRKNILLIRTEGDQKKFVRLDITSSKIFQSPYYYLKQRDIIYVEPNRYKREGADQSFLRYLGIVSTVISFVSLLFIFQSIKF